MIADVRKLTITDLPEIVRVYDSQDNILKIKKTTHIDLYYYRVLKLFVSGDPTMCAFGSFDGDRLIAFSTCNLWATLPYWTIGLFYTDSEYITSIHNVDITGVLKAFITSYAEARRMYTAYSISTINALGARAWQQEQIKGHSNAMWSGDAPRYSITIEEIIPPFSNSKNGTFGQMLGITEGLNTVPLVVTKWTLSNEFRNHQISKKHTKRLNKLSNA